MIFHLSLSLTLLALVAGMYLLAKTKKEELGNFFRWISYFVIASSLICFACCLCHGLCGAWCRSHCPDGGMEECRGGMGMDCGHGGGMRIEKHIRMGGGCEDRMEREECMGMSGCCKGMGRGKCGDHEEMEMHGCKEGGMKNCCKGHEEGEEKEIKKDTIVIKKK